VTDGADHRQVVGFYSDPRARLWDFLRERGDAALKPHGAVGALL
jgi:hypothetical protein